MAAIDDLNAAITDLGTALTANNAEIEKLLAKISAATTTPTGTPDPEVEAAVTAIRALIATNATEVAKATAVTG